MGILWVRVSAGAFAAMVMMSGSPVISAEQEAGQIMAQQLTERTREPETKSEDSDGNLSDSAVRVMSSYAWSILPDEVEGPAGATISLDKSDPTKFFIPVEDARTVIRTAMRSAYAQICDLPELGQRNFRTMMDQQENRGVWSLEQMQFINTLHMFSVSYFTGDLKITEKEEGDSKAGGAASKAAEDDEAFNPSRPTCTPEKKEAVTQAINEYLASAKASQGAAAPAAPAAPAPTVPSGNVPERPNAPIAQPVEPNSTGAN